MQHDESELTFRADSAAFLRLEATDPTGFEPLLTSSLTLTVSMIRTRSARAHPRHHGSRSLTLAALPFRRNQHRRLLTTGRASSR
jgi:hypothetical protein